MHSSLPCHGCSGEPSPDRAGSVARAGWLKEAWDSPWPRIAEQCPVASLEAQADASGVLALSTCRSIIRPQA